LQQPACGKVLQPFVRVGNVALQRYFLQKKRFRLFNVPNAQPGGAANIVLIK